MSAAFQTTSFSWKIYTRFLPKLQLNYPCRYYKRYQRAMPKKLEAQFRTLDDAFFNFSFAYFDLVSQTEKLCQFKRKTDETLDKLLQRISGKINDFGSKKKQKNKAMIASSQSVSAPLTVEFQNDGVSVSTDMLCSDLFNESNDQTIKLRIGDLSYIVYINQPYVDYLVLPQPIMAGCPVYPYKLKLLYSEFEKSQFSWFKFSENKTDATEVLLSDFIYFPTCEDINSFLVITCTPTRDNITGETFTSYSNSVVEAGPGLCPFETRHSFTKEVLKDDSFRVVSYNILADLYASSEIGKNTLFSYCAPYALKVNYRKLLTLKELIGYNADLICLQEVDVKIFVRDLQPVLRFYGFDGVLSKKGGQVNEGEACFYRRNRFKLISNRSFILGQEQCQNEPSLKDIWDLVQMNQNLYCKVKDKNTVLQILVFEFLGKPNHKVIVGNTHLYFHPDADHIRMLQAGICLNLINETRNKLTSEDPSCVVSVIFAGDFNSTPECGVYQLFTQNFIPKEHHEWKDEPTLEGAEIGIDLHNPIPFGSACGTPEFTNYTSDFSGCLDYIFYDTDRFQVEQVVPFPDKEDVLLHVAIPSIVFPSDHLSLVADLKWKS